MTIRRNSAAAILLLQVLFILSAFALLSLRDEKFDPIVAGMGVLLAFYNVLQYNMLRGAFRHIDRFVLLAAQFLWSIGLVVICRINADDAVKQFALVLGGSIAMALAMLLTRRSRRFGKKAAWWLMGVSVVLLASTFVLGRTIAGARNWISLGPISFQPSEIVKVLFIAVSAYFLATRDKLVSFLPYVGYTAICVIVLVVSKDLGAALLIGGTFLIMFFAATGRVLLTLAGVGVLGVGAVASYHLFSHVRTRVEVWRDPWASYNGSGYQIVQGLLALASGGLLGVGLGRGMPGVIPAAETDYIFTVIGEEFGIIVGVMVIAFYLVFIVRGMLIALDTKDVFDMLLVFGCTAMLSLQSFIIIAGVIKLIPLTGITLPFISAGGSSMLASMLMLGVIEGVAVKNGVRDEKALRMMGGEML